MSELFIFMSTVKYLITSLFCVSYQQFNYRLIYIVYNRPKELIMCVYGQAFICALTTHVCTRWHMRICTG